MRAPDALREGRAAEEADDAPLCTTRKKRGRASIEQRHRLGRARVGPLVHPNGTNFGPELAKDRAVCRLDLERDLGGRREERHHRFLPARKRDDLAQYRPATHFVLGPADRHERTPPRRVLRGPRDQRQS